MSARSSARRRLRIARQAARSEELTQEEFKANPEACRTYIIFGGNFDHHIISSALRGRASKRSLRAAASLIKRNHKREAETKLREIQQKKEQESTARKMQRKAAKMAERAGNFIMRKGVA